MLGGFGCQAQNKQIMESNKNNPLLCDPQGGACEIPTTPDAKQQVNIPAAPKTLKIIYFTDPICSSCWGIEPQLRKLKLEYGKDIEIEYHMGGLLPDWSYNSGGISKPSDVAHHWDVASAWYKMPIDGDVWLEDPLHSSYPPSIAFKAAELQSKEKAMHFMRLMREMVFLRKQNIAKWEVIEKAAAEADLDTKQLKEDYDNAAKRLFEQDLNLAKQMGVRGFPSVFVTDAQGNSEFVYGSKPYADYERAFQKIFPGIAKNEYAKDWKSLFAVYPTLTTREFAELSDVSMQQAEKELEALVKAGSLTKFSTKNGPLWLRK